ncbi:hypothetical protein H112_00647 [Trichophyton rubrum D6]|uniref:Uncharacterized protein n=5 Tax=Trichophyton TaxID=5550 RepID=A0A178F527_TRIRU|nr:uncharacterized protein TERG_07769 [Trichophyton rubrum CBS 118892]EZF27351.1 hypothetical protein H100_00647 [Trichophyton rubrum MR850]EZF46393.1 hypothetical protein H102_00644 [Trichophyton rubrum CBS 100081]EZF57015.1 hypothetical protein H103_00646 [Trichophyton rubrum CBS 288.86]EZF67648.1 hypothetical protein H104_00633 [Trichophyton rubrum CBS 289.86]EZF78241.1 hypothetical protein H105_00642 [Trichophyton soudanense CBS 452.61]EZF88948.1 hypothetical protein H110_00651 [Trichophy
MQFSVAIISLFVAHVAAVATPDPAQVARLSTSIQVRNGQEVGFIPAVSAVKRDGGSSDGYHNFCNGPCTGWFCTVGANPQCCLTDNGCGCCWFMDGAAYFADTRPADKQSKHGGILDAGSVKNPSDKGAPTRRPQSQYKVGGSKSKVG